ncbi:MAG: S41 family peptidase [Candidatus Doudnabacteria bacterium]|nr:S41 family peptidase [Candidatus Doudnabacteria bacterium]
MYDQEFNRNSNRKYFIASISILALAGAFAGGYFFSRAGYQIELAPVRVVNLNRENAPQELNWQILWDAIKAINEKYVERPVDQQALLFGAVSGLVDSLGDPYSVFLTPAKSEEFKNDLKGEFSGVGAEIGIRAGRLVVIAPIDDSPAKAAGLRPLDAILEIDGESTENLNLEDAVNKIRGPKGTTVVLTIDREGDEEPRKVSIVRDKIVVKSVSVEIKEVSGKKIGVIKLRRFGEDTKGELDRAITQLLNENVRGVALDLRNNPGGYIIAAVEVASAWVKEGELVVTEQFGDGRKTDYNAEGVSRLAGVPTVVLVNEGSASASEIVAGALSDHKLATLVGKKTFGKGSVQELVDLPDGADLKVTIAKWLTPSGKDINVAGISPDIEIEITEEDSDQLKDPQLDRALEELEDKMI